MKESSPHTRVSRSRRAIALMAWGFSITTAVILWDARQSGALRTGANPVAASLLAAFSAFVAVFAWMLFNPNRRRATDSFAAAAATLFPPPVIAFCLISSDSPLRWWMAMGIAMLVIIAVLSQVPDEFFGVPRGRSSYLVPLPLFDRMENGVLDPNASWFTFNDLSKVVSDTERPSLAPRAYRSREPDTRTANVAYGPSRPVSEVDDILGTDYDIGLLDDSLMDMELDTPSISSSRTIVPSRTSHTNRPEATPQKRRSAPAKSVRRPSSQARHQPTYQHNPLSGHLHAAAGLRQRNSRIANLRHRMARRDRHAASIRQDTSTDQRPAFEQRNSSFSSNRQSDARSSRSVTSPAPEAQNYRTPVNQQQASRNTNSPAVPPRHSGSGSNSAIPGQREPQTDARSKAPATAYSRETNRRRANRHRKQDDSSQTRYESTHQTESVQETRSRADKTSRRTGDKSTETARGRVFGIPLPFGTRGETNEATPPPNSIRDSASEAADHEQRSSLTSGTVTDSERRIRPSRSPSAEKPQSTVPDRQQRRSRYEDEPVQQPQRPTSEAASSTASRQPNSGSSNSSATHFERTQDSHGSELVEGVMKIRFDKGQKRANLHIPFSPPLPGMPEVECECVGDTPLRLKVPVRQSYGIRIEARRTDAGEELETDIGFAAVYTPE